MQIVIISDTHLRHSVLKIPKGDILIHCGDMLNFGKPKELVSVNDWFGSLPFDKEHIICVAGNHDFIFEKDPGLAKILLSNATYLQDSSYEVDGLKFWGSPRTHPFFNWAFETNDRKREMIWNSIPVDTDIIITHGPPYNIGDENREGIKCGDKLLRKRIEEIEPKYHLSGHIHESWGKIKIGKTTYINASIMDRDYRPVNLPIVVEI